MEHTVPEERDAPPLPFTAGRYAASEQELVRVRRRVWRLHLLAPLVSFIALAAGFHLGWPLLTAAGVVGFGVVACAIGAFAIAERRLLFYVRNYQSDRYRHVLYEGLAAVPLGAALFAAGAWLIALTFFYLMGSTIEALRAAMLARPSLALVPLGVIMTATGLGFAIGFSHPARTMGQRLWLALLNLPARLGGVILLMQGAVVLAIGLLDWLSPATFDAGFQWIFENPWPFRR